MAPHRWAADADPVRPSDPVELRWRCSCGRCVNRSCALPRRDWVRATRRRRPPACWSASVQVWGPGAVRRSVVRLPAPANRWRRCPYEKSGPTKSSDLAIKWSPEAAVVATGTCPARSPCKPVTLASELALGAKATGQLTEMAEEHDGHQLNHVLQDADSQQRPRQAVVAKSDASAEHAEVQRDAVDFMAPGFHAAAVVSGVAKDLRTRPYGGRGNATRCSTNRSARQPFLMTRSAIAAAGTAVFNAVVNTQSS